MRLRVGNLRTLVLLMLFGLDYAVAYCAEAPPPGLTIHKGELFKAGHRYRGVGANYYDLFLRVLDQPTNTSSLNELARLGQAGIPFVRFATMYGAEQVRFYVEHRREFFERLDLVVRAAERSRVGLIPSFNWTFALSEVAGEPRDQWGNPQSRTIELMRRYVGDIVERYKDSQAIWAWEFGNEPNLSADLPNASQLRKPGGTERDDVQSAYIQTSVSEFVQEVRRHDHTRPLFSGNSHPRVSAWHNTRERTWTPDSRDQFREILLRDNPATLATICVHLYGNTDVQKEMAAWATNRRDWLAMVKSIVHETRRPLFVGEFGVPATLGEPLTRTAFTQLLAEMDEAGVDLAAFWVFDFGDQRDDWSVDFGNSRAYMLELTAEANRRWNRQALESESQRRQSHTEEAVR